jgi:hypothetical protein
MSGSCCGGSTKSDAVKVTTLTASQANEAAGEHSVATNQKTSCCDGKSAKSEKRECCC